MNTTVKENIAFTAEELKYMKGCISREIGDMQLKLQNVNAIRLSVPAIKTKRDEMASQLKREINFYKGIICKIERKQLAE